jgi:hypothetical protein
MALSSCNHAEKLTINKKGVIFSCCRFCVCSERLEANNCVDMMTILGWLVGGSRELRDYKRFFCRSKKRKMSFVCVSECNHEFNPFFSIQGLSPSFSFLPSSIIIFSQPQQFCVLPQTSFNADIGEGEERMCVCVCE